MKILITGISGFIGKNVARNLLKKNVQITAIVRPNTNFKRIAEFENKVKFIEIDLTNIATLRNFLSENAFVQIIHIGAIRGGRKFTKQQYFDANVNATEQLIINAKKHNSKFIFCSSVGVFGAIPKELPANNFTERQEDNYYHFTKIYAEKIIQKHVLNGLSAAIVRPAITYGEGDFGFPFTLTKLVDKNLMFLPNHEVKIHLTNIELIVQAFNKLSEIDFKSGTAYNVADLHPVKLTEIVDFINQELHQKKYSRHKIINVKFFDFGEKIARFLKNELWVSRFELISKSWYYNTQNSYTNLGLKHIETIPNFKIVTNWYKGL
ncbi:MAG: NAD(P)-dependent oxidoreductase [Candidatus Cloacimonetes bacterium]|jgi:nucleoside-diphosphate-sugar epimerase|nr:NAD(P)-dependent oxidoreductase [Candidatus Cloacimonadota bacterium]MBT6994073.1 NAD(P)-dependent oxidoreductase [Candidatus Cloacimonadota bacterium]MBT7469600.1 NAD(P)-dependent oxidoreductase [Candidatus Cloacimonadota bacterium]